MSGLQNINYRIPDEWSSAWFARFIRDVLANADVRNAVAGSGITITGTPDVPATISSGIDVQQLIAQPYILAVPSTPAGFLTHERVLAADPDGVISITDGGPNADLTLSIVAIPYSKLPTQPELSLLGNAFDSSDDPSPIEGAVQYAIPHIADIGAGVLNILFSTIDHNYISDFNEAAQDAVGTIFVDSSSIDFTYNDGVPSMTASVITANPTASVGLTANNGSAATPMRSDASPALDVGISPTWTGTHTFREITYINPDPQTIPAAAIAVDGRLILADNAGIAVQCIAIGASLNAGYRFTCAGGTFATPTAVSIANVGYMGYLGASGFDGTNWQIGSAAIIGMRPAGTWSGTSRPTKIVLEVTDAGSTTRNVKAVLDSNAQFMFDDGSVGAPGVTWINDPNTGRYRIGADNMGDAVGGALVWEYLTTRVRAYVPIRMPGYTVATLPAGAVGDTAYVTNALAPAFGVAVAGGGAVTVPVFYDGAAWIVG